MTTGPLNPVDVATAAISCGLLIPPTPRVKPLRPPRNKHWKLEPKKKIGVLCCRKCGEPAEWCGDGLGFRIVCRECEPTL